MTGRFNVAILGAWLSRPKATGIALGPPNVQGSRNRWLTQLRWPNA